MTFFDKAKAAAGMAAAKAKQGAEDLQAKVDLSSAYDELGKATYDLIESGEIAHERLDEAAAKVRALRQRADDKSATGEAAEAVEAAPAADVPDAT